MGASRARSAEMKGQNKMKKQSAKTTTSTIRATIDFENIYEVMTLENGFKALINNESLTDSERKELLRVADLIESMTGNTFNSYWLEKHN